MAKSFNDFSKYYKGLILIFILLLFWEIAVEFDFISNLVLPKPSKILKDGIIMVGKSKRFKGIKDPDILSGEGSRKWSAFNVAKLYNVDLVIAVSQDGPIYIYKHNNSHEVTIIKIE